MASGPQKAFCVSAYMKSVVTVQRQFRRKYGRSPPSQASIRAWYKPYVTDGCVCKRKNTGRPSVSAEHVETIRQSFVRSTHRCVRRASKELNVHKTTVWQVLRKHLHLRPYRLQILQQLKPTDKVKRCDLCCSFLGKLAVDDTIMNKLVFSDEATFHRLGRLNRHNLRIWGQWKSSWVIWTWKGQSQGHSLCGSVTRKAVQAILLYRINSDRDHLPGHVMWMVNAAAAGGHFRLDLSTRRYPTALP
jgi:hypothetical protein